MTASTFADHAMSAIDEFTPAREVLLNAGSSETAVRLACEILAESTNWHDACAVAKYRLLHWNASTDMTQYNVEDLFRDLARDDEPDEYKVIGWYFLAALATVVLVALVVF
ncbi:MAG: hypothetical protein JWQ44_2942 [Chthoniobacter sp.]|nr:hypothetical protein [Chthoniobacter sp.]